MKRLCMLLIALMASIAWASMFQIEISDVDGTVFTDANSVTVYRPGTSTVATIWTNEGMGTALTNPIVTGLDDGRFEFYGDYPYYDIKVTSSTTSAVVKRSGIKPTMRQFLYSAGVELAGTLELSGSITTETDLTVAGDANLAGDVNLGSTTGDVVSVLGQTDFGVSTAGVDVNIYGDTAANYALFDASNNWWQYVSIDSWLDDTAILYLGTDKDWSIKSNTTKNLNVLPVTTDETSILNVGADTAGADVKLFAATTGDYIQWDASDEAWESVDAQIHLDDGSILQFGSDKDFGLASASTATLTLTPLATDESPVVNLGADTTGVDLKLFAATTGDYMQWDASDEALEGVDSQIHLDDGSILQFGTDKDFAVASASAATLTITPLATDETPIINLGANTTGIDLKLFGATTGNYVHWDASANTLLAVGGSKEYGFYKEVEIVVAADTLTAAESGKVFVVQGLDNAEAGDLALTLPTAAAGLTYTFVDANTTAADDLWITAASGDKINGGTAAKSYKCTGDAVGQFVTIVAGDATDWYVIAQGGTWSNDNN